MDRPRYSVLWAMAFVVIGVAALLLSASRLVAASVPNAALPSPSARATPSPHAGKGPDDVIGRHCGGIGPVRLVWMHMGRCVLSG